LSPGGDCAGRSGRRPGSCCGPGSSPDWGVADGSAATRAFFPSGLRGDEPSEASQSPAPAGMTSVSAEEGRPDPPLYALDIGGASSSCTGPPYSRGPGSLLPGQPRGPNRGAAHSSRPMRGLTASLLTRRAKGLRSAPSCGVTLPATIKAAAAPVLRTRTPPLRVTGGKAPKTS